MPDPNDLATAWETSSATQFGVPADSRNFSRPGEPNFAASYSGDSQAAEDGYHSDGYQTSSAPKASEIIKAFQQFLGQSQPLIGQVYSGPIDGLPNAELQSAAQKVETILAQTVHNPGSHGLLWNVKSQTFNTTTQDLAKALELLSRPVFHDKSEQKLDKAARYQELKNLQNKIIFR